MGGNNSHTGHHGYWSCIARITGHFSGMFDRFSAIVIFFFVFLFTSAFIVTHWMEISAITGPALIKELLPPIQSPSTLHVNCSIKCPENQPAITQTLQNSSSEQCPEYFRWIHEDLRPWKDTGITREMVERAREPAHIRIVVVKGRVYVEKLKWVFQTRDVFNVWGILQLLRFYPGALPDLDIMFECGDKPVIRKSDYRDPKGARPPPLFHYCGDDETLDIVFPDWSFWGWPEINIKPWEALRRDLEEGNRRIKWEDRDPHAYWKGNAVLGEARIDLVRCNLSDKQDWNARIYGLDWDSERTRGFKSTELANQCDYRYKIYVEGFAWSVSEKYILACNSLSLLVNPHYYDFFTRELVPTVHYWPIDMKNKCRSIKFAVDWGNNHTQQGQEIGKTATKFIREKLTMKHVYDYMFHLLSNYGKLLKYNVTVPEGAVEVCLETMTCSQEGLHEVYKVSSMVKSPSTDGPCNLPPPFDPSNLQRIVDRKANLEKQVEKWEATGNIEEVKLPVTLK